MELTIARHCVAEGPDGLSPLQRDLIAHPARVRIAEAPTGAGKSYAFQRALRDRGARILFGRGGDVSLHCAQGGGWPAHQARACRLPHGANAHVTST